MTTQPIQTTPVEPALELSTKAPARHHILIDDQAYFFARLESLGWDKRQALGRAFEEMQKLETDGMDEAGAVRHGELVWDICRVVLPDCPEDVLAVFEPYDRESIAAAFLGVTVGTSNRLAMISKLRLALSQQPSSSTTGVQTPRAG